MLSNPATPESGRTAKGVGSSDTPPSRARAVETIAALKFEGSIATVPRASRGNCVRLLRLTTPRARPLITDFCAKVREFQLGGLCIRH